VDRSETHLSEEIWTAPSGDSMMGVWRYLSDGRLRISEILSITAEAEGPTMRLRHFDPKLIGREDKDKPVVFRLVAWKAREAVFEGPGVSARVSSGSPTGGRRTTPLWRSSRRVARPRSSATGSRDLVRRRPGVSGPGRA